MLFTKAVMLYTKMSVYIHTLSPAEKATAPFILRWFQLRSSTSRPSLFAVQTEGKFREIYFIHNIYRDIKLSEFYHTQQLSQMFPSFSTKLIMAQV